MEGGEERMQRRERRGRGRTQTVNVQDLGYSVRVKRRIHDKNGRGSLKKL